MYVVLAPPSFPSLYSRCSQQALVLYLRTLASNKYVSASAFAPICNPTKSPWGEKAFGGYLGEGVEEGKEWDATELIAKAKGKELNILVDVGTGDQFYKQKQREFGCL